MSTHLLIAAMYLEDLPQGAKLVLAGIADSADEHTLESAPGLPKLRAWSGLGKSQTMAHVTALEDAKLIERIEAGRLGRRAVYRVFPLGVPAIPHPSEVAARYSSPGSSTGVDNPTGEGPASRTLGSDEGPSRVRPTGPLHANPSVSTREAPLHSPQVGDSRRPAPPASGFPGSRATAEEDRAVARRARGAHNVPCHVPEHAAAGEVMPCGRCAYAAANADPEKIAQAKAAIRASLRTATVPPTTDTEEPTP